MAVFGARTEILSGGIATVQIRNNGTDQTFYSLPFLRDVKVVETPLIEKDVRGRPVTYGYKFACTGRVMATGDATNFFPVLDDFCDVLLDSKITAQNGTIWDTAGANGAGCGFYWKFVSDSDMDSNRHLEFRIDRTYKVADSDAFHTAQTNTNTATDTELAKLANLTTAHIVPAGFQSVAWGTGNYTDFVSSILRNCRFTAETIVLMDSFGRSLPYQVQVDFEADIIPTDQAVKTSKVIDSHAGLSPDVKITFADGITASFPRSATEASDKSLGFAIEVHNESDADGVQFLHMVGSGRMTPAKFAGIFA